MSVEITTPMVEQYRSNVRMLVQQRGSVLRDAVMIETVTGKNAFFEQIGSTVAKKRLTRHGDSPLVDTPHRRRRVSLVDYEWGDLIDDPDRLRLLIEPQGPYSLNAAMALGRAIDSDLITAFDANADTGADGSTSTPFDATMEVTADVGGGNTNMNYEKLLRARKLLQAKNVDMTETLHVAMTAAQLESLLQQAQTASADYNTVRALVTGELNTFLGFRFHFTELLPMADADDRKCFAWAESGMVLAMGEDIMTRVAERPDKAFSTYVFARMTIGATRLEEEKVVRILCDDDATP